MVVNPLIRRLELAGPLSAVERDALGALTLKPRLVPARTDVWQNGTVETLPLIMTGIACRYRVRPEGQRRIVHFLLPGDLYDHYASSRFTSEWSLGALTPCGVVDIQRQALDALAGLHPGIARALWWVTFVELEIEREWLINDSRPADKRLAHFFCELLVRLQGVGLADGDSFELRLTQVDLADATAVSFVHMNRVLQSLRSSRLIVYDKGRLQIPDYARLCEFAEFDPAYMHLCDRPAGAQAPRP
ncbi:hypothetical protein OPKNFCMD_6430 [Methylobacterium crusticola]|uniref:HTH crp-type domain-containing protein n=1 Tax=Methylobacterium crusticola TaxID=1697972 RepID=A0ABQ4R7I6_9HYPH|nr:Crp/Fnr family transcriptional regulator [Methylobacterium crusticola]GJD53653.1 hypothetical protein OPKNFCMD_6430 [Methylobacterium crusticola]